MVYSQEDNFNAFMCVCMFCTCLQVVIQIRSSLRSEINPVKIEGGSPKPPVAVRVLAVRKIILGRCVEVGNTNNAILSEHGHGIIGSIHERGDHCEIKQMT